MTTHETHCIHLHTHTKQNPARAAIRDSGAVIHLCAVCAADRLTEMLRRQSPSSVARSVDFTQCSHIEKRPTGCLVCSRGVAGALILFWSVLRSQTVGSTVEANPLLRLIENMVKTHGPLFRVVREDKERAVASQAQLETRGMSSDGHRDRGRVYTSRHESREG